MSFFFSKVTIPSSPLKEILLTSSLSVSNTTDAAVEKHLPVVTQEENKITVAVSSVEHPMLPEHYIMGVYIETKNGGQLHKFAPGDKPEAVFMLADGDEFIAAYEYCNLHGLWKSEV